MEENNETFKEQLYSILNCSKEEFYQKYKNYKEAEKEFKQVFEPFKESLIQLHADSPNLPKSIIIEGLKLTYVSPNIRNTLDSKRLKEEEPELVKKFTKLTNVSATVKLEEV